MRKKGNQQSLKFVVHSHSFRVILVSRNCFKLEDDRSKISSRKAFHLLTYFNKFMVVYKIGFEWVQEE